MPKITIYISDDMKRALEVSAASRGMSETDLIRQALRVVILETNPPRPRIPLFKSGNRSFAEDAEHALRGFGKS